MKKRLLSLLLVVAMVSTLLPVLPSAVLAKAASIAWDGSTKTEPGTDEDGVYQISSGAELAWFADYVNQLSQENNDNNVDTTDGNGLIRLHAVLTDDIDLGGNTWTPISNTSYAVYAYGGTFDGQCHTISGLAISATTAGYGLFGFVNDATIRNLKVNGTIESSNGIGGIIGKIQTGTVENCSMSGTVTSTGTSTKGYAGGIIGTCNSTGAIIKGCYNTASISGSYAGGILGYNTKSAAISHCYNTGTITGSTRSAGIAGQSSSGSISYCYSIGTSKNGICGFSNATITSCYYLAENTSDADSAPGGTATGYQEIENADSLLEALNAGAEALFEADTTSINNGYPVLSWQLSSAAATVPVTTVNILGDAITGTTLTAQALGEDEKSATNVTYQWAVSGDNKTYTDIEGAANSTYAIPDTSDYAGTYLKVTVTGEEASTASAVAGPIEKSNTLVEKENKEKVSEAMASLTLDSTVIKEATTLDLPSKSGDCSISWNSSHPSIISNAGVVTLPEQNIVSVALTATITCGTASDTKSFTIDVWAKNIEPEVYLEKILDSIEWDYKNLNPVYGEDTNVIVKFQNLLKKKGYDGVSVTIESTADEALVSKNGKIYYPAIPEGGSFANGKQVQVSFRLTVGEATTVWPDGNSNALLIPWDTSDTKAALENSADAALKEAALCGDNDSLTSVTSNLTLPSCIDGDKYSFAWITWESSDESHLAISNENRQSGADSLYNPYVGKIYPDSSEHSITLTATVTNPSTDISVVRTFDMILLPLGEEQLNQTLETMTKILDCYTPDKLTDFVTNSQLDTTSVDNDIQLVIPKNVVSAEELGELNYGEYWDYWNYKFTVTSSDTEVIDVNSFRAYVYRPLGEDSSADKPVTLTVKMESKANPNLSVSKDITVTVKHLDRAEINEALARMDQAKTDYAKGLLGNNTDIYSVIDNLTPYKEIIWNTDKSGVEFIYRNADMTKNGIVVDELPGWQDQEDWRLFRTSNKDLLSNETLILNETPAEDTFVKINSVLTDEVLGKYYTKFQDNKDYDVEALAKFKQLYKQPVSTYVMAVGAGQYTDTFTSMTEEEKASIYHEALSTFKREQEQPISVSFTLLGLDGTAIIAKTQETSFTNGATVFDVFKKVLADNDIPYTARGSYISSINGLSEFEYGDHSGWMYTVGGVLVNSYMNAQELSDGEEIIVKYVKDYTLANTPETKPDVPDEPDDKKEEPDTNTGKTDATEPATNTNSPNTSTENDSNSIQKDTGKVTKAQAKKTIQTLKLTKYKKGTKKLVGKTQKKAKVVVKIGKKKYTVKSNKKGKFVIKLSKKLKKKDKIQITVSRKGYKTKKKTVKVK